MKPVGISQNPTDDGVALVVVLLKPADEIIAGRLRNPFEIPEKLDRESAPFPRA